eukprot:Skav211772  [mRNA]  locus=scaffold674:784344:786773:+ [translate_table: standard]
MLDALAKGAEVNNTTGGRHETPLMLAAAARSAGASACLRLLLDARAEVDSKATPLAGRLCCMAAETTAILRLVKARAHVGVTAHDGRNALMLATLEGGSLGLFRAAVVGPTGR